MEESTKLFNYYRPDEEAKAYWNNRLEDEYLVEVIKIAGHVLTKALVKTQKGVLMVIPIYRLFIAKRGS